MQNNRTNSHYAILPAIIVLLLLQTGVVAAVPELAVTPQTVNLTGNASIPVNVANDTAFNITNQNQTKRIYNVTLPERPWLTWSANNFDLNASETRSVTATLTPSEAGNLTDQFEIPYEYNQTGLNESQFGRSWQMTFDKNYYPSLQFAIDAYYRDTGIEVTSLDHAFTLELGESGHSVFKLTNTGPETAYDIQISGENLSFDHAERFNLSAGDEALIPFAVLIPKPETNPVEAKTRPISRWSTSRAGISTTPHCR